MSHPNIVKFLGFQKDEHSDEEAMLYMEYGGNDLREYVRTVSESTTTGLRKRTPPKALSIFETWSILMDLAAALAFCHHGVSRTHDTYIPKAPWAAILHRDIKPANGISNISSPLGSMLIAEKF